MINTEYTCPECKSRFVPRDQYTPEFMGRCPDCMKFITAYPPGYVAPKKVHHVNNLDRRSELIKSFESAGDTWDRARAIAIYSDLLQVPDLELCGIKRGAVLHNRAILYLKDGKLPQSYSDITESIGLAEKEPSAGSSSGLAEAYKIKVDLLSRMKACR